MNLLEKPLPENCYFHDEAAPPGLRPPGDTRRQIDGILAHFTVGQSAVSAYYTFRGAPAALGYPEGTPYLIDNNGDVWKLFDEGEAWSYHIGCSGAWAMNHKHDKRLVGIEVASIGPLELGHDGKSLVWNGGRTVFGIIGDPRCPAYKRLDTPFRGYQYFAAFPQAQIMAFVQLADMLQKKWQFPRIIPPLTRVAWSSTAPERVLNCRFGYDESFFADRKGIVSHVNFRESGKWDWNPSAPELWDALKADGWAEQV